MLQNVDMERNRAGNGGDGGSLAGSSLPGANTPGGTAGEAGALYLSAGAQAEISASLLSVNWAGTGGTPSGSIGTSFPGGNGGAIVAAQTARLHITGSTINENFSGGGVYHGSAGSTDAGHGGGIFIENCTLTNNRTGEGLEHFMYAGRSGSGGGIYNRSANLVVLNSRFIANEASRCARGVIAYPGEGGAIYNNGENATVVSCLFQKNLSGDSYEIVDVNEPATGKGGDGSALLNDGGSMVIINSIFDANQAGNGNIDPDNTAPGGPGGNGAIMNRDGQMDIVNCTIINNIAGAGGYGADGFAPDGKAGVVTDGTGATRIFNSVVWENKAAPYDFDNAYEQQVFSIQGTLEIYNSCVAGIDDTTNENINMDPGLSGGTMPSSDSPLIGAGASDRLPPDLLDLNENDDLQEPIPFDYTGNARVLGGIVDIGAYEVR
jgi:hypothetical protein